MLGLVRGVHNRSSSLAGRERSASLIYFLPRCEDYDMLGMQLGRKQMPLFSRAYSKGHCAAQGEDDGRAQSPENRPECVELSAHSNRGGTLPGLAPFKHWPLFVAEIGR